MANEDYWTIWTADPVQPTSQRIQVQYRANKRKLNSQADVLSRLRSLRHAKASLYKEITTLLDDNTKTMDQVALFSDSNVINHNVLTLENLQNLSMVPIISTKIFQKQQIARFYRDIVPRLHTGKHLAFLTSDEETLLGVEYGEELIVLLRALQTRVLYLCHFVRLSGHSDGRWLYCFLRTSFNWLFMSVDYYAIVRSFITCERYRVRLCAHWKPMKMLPALSLLQFMAINILEDSWQPHGTTSSSKLKWAVSLTLSVQFYSSI